MTNAGGQAPPTARIIASATRGRGSLSVDLSCECASESAPLVAYRWDFGDGSTASGPTTTVNLGPGRHHLALEVVNAHGLAAWDKIEVVVTDGDQEPPECLAAADPPAGAAPLDTVLTAHTAPGSRAVGSIRWVFGPSEERTERIVQRRFDEPGRHPVTLEVQDAAGLSCRDQVVVTALSPSGVPPRIVSTPLGSAACGATYAYDDAGAARARGDGPFTWTAKTAPEGFFIDPSTGSVSWPVLPSHRGVHDVSLEVRSPAGVDVQTFSVEVACPSELAFDTSCGCGAAGRGPWVGIGLLLLLARALLRLRTAA
ncbi:MAG: PKD domain-containing protein [Myxococcota bacterium]